MSDFKVTMDDLHHPRQLIQRLDHAEEPSFLAIVLLSAVVLIFLLIGELLFVGIGGRRLVPGATGGDLEPNSMLVVPGSGYRV